MTPICEAPAPLPPPLALYVNAMRLAVRAPGRVVVAERAVGSARAESTPIVSQVLARRGHGREQHGRKRDVRGRDVAQVTDQHQGLAVGADVRLDGHGRTRSPLPTSMHGREQPGAVAAVRVHGHDVGGVVGHGRLAERWLAPRGRSAALDAWSGRSRSVCPSVAPRRRRVGALARSPLAGAGAVAPAQMSPSRTYRSVPVTVACSLGGGVTNAVGAGVGVSGRRVAGEGSVASGRPSGRGRTCRSAPRWRSGRASRGASRRPRPPPTSSKLGSAKTLPPATMARPSSATRGASMAAPTATARGGGSGANPRSSGLDREPGSRRRCQPPVAGDWPDPERPVGGPGCDRLAGPGRVAGCTGGRAPGWSGCGRRRGPGLRHPVAALATAGYQGAGPAIPGTGGCGRRCAGQPPGSGSRCLAGQPCSPGQPPDCGGSCPGRSPATAAGSTATIDRAISGSPVMLPHRRQVPCGRDVPDLELERLEPAEGPARQARRDIHRVALPQHVARSERPKQMASSTSVPLRRVNWVCPPFAGAHVPRTARRCPAAVVRPLLPSSGMQVGQEYVIDGTCAARRGPAPGSGRAVDGRRQRPRSMARIAARKAS